MDLGRLIDDLDPKIVREVVDLLRENSEELAELAESFPEVVDMITGALGEAGGQAGAVGQALAGEGGQRLAMLIGLVATVTAFVADRADDVSRVPVVGAPVARLGAVARSVSGTTRDLSRFLSRRSPS